MHDHALPVVRHVPRSQCDIARGSPTAHLLFTLYICF